MRYRAILWMPSTRRRTEVRRWKWKRSCPSMIVIIALVLSRTTLIVSIIRGSDDAFAAKHMPDLGHEVKDFTVFSWKLNNWKKLEKKITSPDFECGGHKWYVCVAGRLASPSLTLWRAGVSSSFPSATPTHHQMTRSLSISTMLTPNEHRRAGTHVLSSLWSSRMFTTPPSTPSAVRNHLASPLNFAHIDLQMHTIVSLLRNATGASRALANSASCSACRMAIHVPQLRTSLRK